jgi:hypothetical protein
MRQSAATRAAAALVAGFVLAQWPDLPIVPFVTLNTAADRLVA